MELRTLVIHKPPSFIPASIFSVCVTTSYKSILTLACTHFEITPLRPLCTQNPWPFLEPGGLERAIHGPLLSKHSLGKRDWRWLVCLVPDFTFHFTVIWLRTRCHFSSVAPRVLTGLCPQMWFTHSYPDQRWHPIASRTQTATATVMSERFAGRKYWSGHGRSGWSASPAPANNMRNLYRNKTAHLCSSIQHALYMMLSVQTYRFSLFFRTSMSSNFTPSRKIRQIKINF